MSTSTSRKLCTRAPRTRIIAPSGARIQRSSQATVDPGRPAGHTDRPPTPPTESAPDSPIVSGAPQPGTDVDAQLSAPQRLTWLRSCGRDRARSLQCESLAPTTSRGLGGLSEDDVRSVVGGVTSGTLLRIEPDGWNPHRDAVVDVDLPPGFL